MFAGTFMQLTVSIYVEADENPNANPIGPLYSLFCSYHGTLSPAISLLAGR